MGRVQDAMRRAAEAEKAKAPIDARTLAADFPQEAPAADAVTTPDEPVMTAAMAADTGLDDLRPETPDAPEETPAAATAPAETNRTSVLARFGSSLSAKVVVDQQMVASSKEQYRRLAAALHHAKEASGLQVVMIASAVAGEGKSLTAANLAMTFSESYQRSVLLIDGDLRRPSLHKVFKIDAPAGLSDALMSIDEPEMAVYQVSDRLTVLPAGQPNPDPMAGLTSPRMKRLLDEARESFDWVFIDTPPVGLLSAANLLAAMVDATVMIIRADRTPYHLVRRAIEAIGPERILGTVLNQAKTHPHGYAYEYYRYYQAPRAEVAKGR